MVVPQWIAYRAAPAPWRYGAAGDPPPLPAAWQCDLAGEALTWSAGVFALFGIAPGARLDRREIVGMYCDESRALLERVRADAIARRGSFTLEARIRRSDGAHRWMRIVADVACQGGRPVQLHGFKQDITDEVADGHVPFRGPLAGD